MIVCMRAGVQLKLNLDMSLGIIDLLVKHNIISAADGALLKETSTEGGYTLIQHVVKSGKAKESQLLEVFSKHYQIPAMKLVNIQAKALEFLPRELIRRYRCLPFQIEADGTLHVAIAEPDSISHVDALKARLGRSVVASFTTVSNLDAAIKRITQQNAAQETHQTTLGIKSPQSVAAKSVKHTSEKSSTIPKLAPQPALHLAMQPQPPEAEPEAPHPTSHANSQATSHATSQAAPVERQLYQPKPVPAPPPIQVTSAIAQGPGTRATQSTTSTAPRMRTREIIQKVRRFKPTEPVAQILNSIFTEAVSKGASDIHIEPQADTICVRFRFEGVLFDIFEIPIEVKEQFSNRVKVTAGMDIAERRVPQDGRARIQVGRDDVNFRASVMPSLFGETIVFRMLKQSDLDLDIAKLSFNKKQLTDFLKALKAPNGMLLVTGPTGSGKTTTMYSAIAALNERSVKIATVEDPIEYNLAGITQVQVNKEAGLDFASSLKGLLRQDPDIIMIGEIRDQETATIAVQAALTGHLVLSSLHTNDAASAVLRLLNMKIEPFAVLAAINAVVAQRLVRKICQHCAQPYQVTEEQLNYLGSDRVIVEGMQHVRGVGCDACFGGGYRGRASIFEVLTLDDGIKQLFLRGENIMNIKKYAYAHGMHTLRQSSLAMVAAGITTLEEAVATTLEH